MSIGLLFPGQGSQYVGMGREIYEEMTSAKKLMHDANEILNFDIRDMIFNGKEEELTLTEIAQPAIFIVSAMYLEKFKQLNEKFEVVAGHSLGEYSALYASGVFSFEDGLKLVRKRGIAMGAKNSQGTMFAIMGVSLDVINAYLEETDGSVVVANINSKNQVVISGYIDDTIKITERLSNIDGAKVKQLNVSGAFHSPLMIDAKCIMDQEIDLTEFNEPCSHVVPNALGAATKNIKIIKQSLKEQITGQVKWLDTINCIKNMQIERLYEVGSGEVLKKLNKTITMKPKCLSL